MRFQFVAVQSLPRLAWCARLRKAQDIVEVYHGPWVETRDNWFVEGAWDAPFCDGRFAEAHVLAGSGGRVTAGEVVFASSSLSVDRIQSMRIGDELLVSNSLPFLLAVSGDEPDPLYRFYRDDLAAYLRVGTSQAHKPLHTRRGRTVLLHDMANVLIRPDLSIRRIEKNVPPPPAGFAGYVDLLQTGMAKVLQNAADPARKHKRYRPLATMSRGYDAPALAVLLRRLGVTEAMTFHGHESRYAAENDSGVEIGNRLGFNVTEYDALQFRKLPGLPEAEFFACPDGADVLLSPVEPQLEGTIFITGRHGDCVFNLHRRRILPHMLVGTTALAGMTLNEFRLRVGFTQYAPLYTAAQHIESIYRISTSAEMKPWSVGGPYDRPIPRRLIEEAGVPRDWFGRRKMAGAHYIVDRVESMSPGGRADFTAYLETLPPIPPVRRAKDAVRIRYVQARAKCVKALLPRAGGLPSFLSRQIYCRASHAAPYNCLDFGFHWGFERIRSRYTVFEATGKAVRE